MATKQFRSPHSPSPIYGIRPGFTVGDLDRGYSTEKFIATASTTGSVAAPAAISPGCRVVKLTVNVTAGSGSVDVSVKSSGDSYSAVLGSYLGLTAGSHDFYLGGWSSPSSGAAYQATQYGPVKSGSSPELGNTTGDEETTNPDPAADSNYIGGTYNPALFLSLDGDDLKVYSTVTGTVTYNVVVTPVS